MKINNRGFTLIEFLVAILILAVGLLGLLQCINIAMERNLENMYRTEAIQLGDDLMMQRRSMAFDTITTAHNIPYLRNTRGVSKSYTVQEAITPVASKSKEIDITVTWTYKNKTFSHVVSSVVSSF